MDEGSTSHQPRLVSPAPTPQNEEDEDVCRVCRLEGDEEMPLIHPCKCSGSVRYVHADCLKNWLAHSQKKQCEICGHHYKFTKIYPDSVPSDIPIAVFLRQTIIYVFRQIVRVLRLYFVSNVWLILLPTINISSLRSFLWMVDHVVPFPLSLATSTDSTSVGNGTLAEGVVDPIAGISTNGTTLLSRFRLPTPGVLANNLRNSWTSWSQGEEPTFVGYIFRGQVLTLSMAAVLMGLIFIREWMSQHNWAEHAEKKELGPINPDEWTIARGQAIKVHDRAMVLQARFPLYLKEWLVVIQQDIDDPATTPRQRSGLDDLYHRMNMIVTLERPLKFESENLAKFAHEHMENFTWHLAYTYFVAVERAIAELSPDATEEDRNFLVDRAHALANRIIEVETKDLSEIKLYHPPPLAPGQALIVDSPLPATNTVLPNAEAGPSQVRPSSPLPSELPEHPTATASDATSGATTGAAGSLQDSNGDTPRTGASRPCNADQEGYEKEVSFAAPELLRGTKGKERATEQEVDRVEIVEPEPTGVVAAQDDVEPKASTASQSGQDSAAPDHEPGPSSPAPLVDPPDLRMNRESSNTSGDTTLSGREDGIGGDGSPLFGSDNGLDTPPNNDDLHPQPIPLPPPLLDGPVPPPRLQRVDPRQRRRGRGAIQEERGRLFAVDAVNENNDADNDQWLDMDELEMDEADELAMDMEDWDGFIEILGFVGPIQQVFQNLCFAIFISGAVMTILIGFPVAIGKIFLSTDLLGSIIYTTDLVFRGLRVLIDPIVDVTYEILKDVVVKPALSSLSALENIVATKAGLHQLPGLSALSTTTLVSNDTLHKAGDIFALIGGSSHDTYTNAVQSSYEIALSTTFSSRVITLCAGYAVVIGSSALVALAGEHTRRTGNGQIPASVADTIEQHGLFLKLSFFMFIELAIFPVILGMSIQVFTLPLKSESNLQTLWTTWKAIPFGSMLEGWLEGTTFMLCFAGLLTQIRKLCRPGTLFFLKDPTENHYNPVKDILERPIISQLRKLITSLIMYAIVLFCLTGFPCWTLSSKLFSSLHVVPLRLHGYQPLSSVPFDLIILPVIVPATWDKLRFEYRCKKALQKWWSLFGSLFRLTPLLHNKTNPTTPESRTALLIWAICDRICQATLGKYHYHASAYRVPKADMVALLSPSERKGKGVFIPLDAAGAPTNPEDKWRLLRQDRAAIVAGRNPIDDYTVIELPIYWRTRVHMLICAALFSSSAALSAVVFVPLIVGREIFSGVMAEDLHDGYNWLAGGYICFLAYYLGRQVRKTILSGTVALRVRRSSPTARAKRAVRSAISRSYLLCLLYGVLPMLVGLIWELYVGVWWRYGWDGDVTIVLHIWDAWASGAALLTIYTGTFPLWAKRHRQRTELRLPLHRLYLHLSKPLSYKSRTVHRFAVTSIALGAVVLLLPLAGSAACVLCIRLMGRAPPNDNRIFLMAVASIGAALVHVAMIMVLRPRWGQMKQSMIDAEYVMEERVENYDPKPPDVLISLEKGKIPRGKKGLDAKPEGKNGDEEVWEDVVDEGIVGVSGTGTGSGSE